MKLKAVNMFMILPPKNKSMNVKSYACPCELAWHLTMNDHYDDNKYKNAQLLVTGSAMVVIMDIAFIDDFLPNFGCGKE